MSNHLAKATIMCKFCIDSQAAVPWTACYLNKFECLTSIFLIALLRLLIDFASHPILYPV